MHADALLKIEIFCICTVNLVPEIVFLFYTVRLVECSIKLNLLLSTKKLLYKFDAFSIRRSSCLHNQYWLFIYVLNSALIRNKPRD